MADRNPGTSEPYVTLVPLDESTGRLYADCFTSHARAALPALYLRAGKYIPPLAKTRGAYIGRCNAEGYRVDADATHIGFTAGSAGEIEPLPTVTPAAAPGAA